MQDGRYHKDRKGQVDIERSLPRPVSTLKFHPDEPSNRLRMHHRIDGKMSHPELITTQSSGPALSRPKWPLQRGMLDEIHEDRPHGQTVRGMRANWKWTLSRPQYLYGTANPKWKSS